MITTDKQAFSAVLARLQADVGRLLDYVEKNEQQIWPFWAFLRMLMPNN